eukprot:SM000058S18478  [mRNA]  locus=s58:105419:109295:+ [translate_table: standard]
MAGARLSALLGLLLLLGAAAAPPSRADWLGSEGRAGTLRASRAAAARVVAPVSEDARLQSAVDGEFDGRRGGFLGLAAWLDGGHNPELLANARALDRSKHYPAFPFDGRIAIATGLAFVGAALANAGGVGGGGLFVPMFNLLLNFDAKTSAALSKAMIMGGMIASFVFNVQLKHPTLNRPLIDYDIALLLQPLLLLGISVGVSCNVMFPPWLIIFLLTVLLLLMSYKTIRTGIKTWKKEARHLQDKMSRSSSFRRPHEDIQHQQDGEPAEGQYNTLPPEEKDIDDWPTYVSVADSGMLVEDKHEVSASVPEEGSLEQGLLHGTPKPAFKRTPSFLENLHIGKPLEKPVQMVNWSAVLVLCFVWICFLAVQILKVHAPVCGPVYWLLNFSQTPVALVATVYGARKLQALHKLRLAGDHPLGAYKAGEVQWGAGRVAIFPLYALVAGTMGGLLGIGGGMVMGPVLLELGILPQVTCATTAFIVVFSSSMSVAEFYLMGRIPIDYALYFSAVCMVAALLGLSIVRAVVVRYGKASIVIFALATVIGASAIVMGIIGGERIWESYRHGDDMGFHSLCNN